MLYRVFLQMKHVSESTELKRHNYRETLRQPGLQPFLWTQFLGAFNDNLFKMVVSMRAVRAAAAGGAAHELSIVSALFALPFLLFSGYAGHLADICSKRTVRVVSKSVEVVATGVALVALISGHLQFTYGVLFLFAVQATFFGPAKYGILPEMLAEYDLSRANGLLEMSTFVAIVLAPRSAARCSKCGRANCGLSGLRSSGSPRWAPRRGFHACPRPRRINE